MKSVTERLAEELHVRLPQVDAAVALLDDKATVPFIARYRKEATGGLDDTQLRTLEERLAYLRELEERRAAILKSIEEQGKLTPELAAAIREADTKARLEDLYLPYKPKRRTQAQIAREAGLEPLGAGAARRSDARSRAATAAAYVDAEKGVADVAAALEGARWILIETFAEDAELVGGLRAAAVGPRRVEVDGRARQGRDGRQVLRLLQRQRAGEARSRRIARWRCCAAARKASCACASTLPDEGAAGPTEPERRIAGARRHRNTRAAPPTRGSPRPSAGPGRSRCSPHLEIDIEQRLREQAEAEAIRVFGRNLHDLLLAAPAGQRVTMGLDPGIRTGVKVAVVDGTGKLLDTATIYPHEPRKDWDGSLRTLGALCARHGVQLIAIGNGTASRETDKLAADLMARHPELALTRSRRLRSGRVGLLGVGARREGVPRSRRVAARRGVDRAAAAGSARRARAHRSEGDRRRPVPARRQPGAARAGSSTPSSRTASTRSAPT